MPVATYLTHPSGVAVPDGVFDGITPVVLPGNTVVEIDDSTPPWFGVIASYIAGGLLTPTNAPAPAGYPNVTAALASLPTVGVAEGSIIARKVTGVGQVVFAYSLADGWEEIATAVDNVLRWSV